MNSLRDFEYLVAVSELKNFGEAAKQCNVSQPTLSGQIKKLEDYLGIEIFERTSRKVLLTHKGRILINQAKQIIQAHHNFKQLAQDLLDPLEGDIHLGLIPTLGPYLLPKVINQLFRELPKVRFSLYENTTNNLLEMLEDGKLDILILPLTKAMSQYTVEHLFDEPLYLAMSEEHPLNKKKSLEVSDLQDQTILTLGNSHCLKEQTLSFCLPNGAIEDTSFQATSLETLRYMVAANRGITFIPALAAMQGEVPVEYRQFSDLTPCREVVIVTRKHHHQHVLIQSISEIIRSKVDFSE